MDTRTNSRRRFGPDPLAFTQPLVKPTALPGAFAYRRGRYAERLRGGFNLGFEFQSVRHVV